MGTSKKNQPPNIVIVVSDALRVKDLSLYTPTKENDFYLKKIAQESVVFENNFSTSNASDPSMTSFFSGQYPSTTGFIHQHPFMKKKELEKLKRNKFWLPLYLQNKGYSTISATPLHLWFKRGFDFYKTQELKGGGNILNFPFIKRILLKLPNWIYSLGKKIIKSRASPEFYSCREVVSLAISKIIESKAKPFFVFMHLVDTHYPYPLVKKQDVKPIRTLSRVLKTLSSSSQKEYVKKRFTDIGASSFEEIERRKDISIREVDKQMGRLTEFLKSESLWENTIFIFLSDHGDNFGEHNTYFCRGGLYDSSIRTPLIVHLPLVAHKTIKQITQNIDISPTLAEILGDRKNFDGKSLIKLIKTGKKIHEVALCFDGFSNKSTMARSLNKKLIVSTGSKCYLCGAIHNKGEEEYDLGEDPEESKNIFSGKDNLYQALDKLNKTL